MFVAKRSGKMSTNVCHNIRDVGQTFANALHYTLGARMELCIKEIAHEPAIVL